MILSAGKQSIHFNLFQCFSRFGVLIYLRRTGLVSAFSSDTFLISDPTERVDNVYNCRFELFQLSCNPINRKKTNSET